MIRCSFAGAMNCITHCVTLIAVDNKSPVRVKLHCQAMLVPFVGWGVIDGILSAQIGQLKLIVPRQRQYGHLGCETTIENAQNLSFRLRRPGAVLKLIFTASFTGAVSAWQVIVMLNDPKQYWVFQYHAGTQGGSKCPDSNSNRKSNLCNSASDEW